VPTPREAVQAGPEQHDHAVQDGHQADQEGVEAASYHRRTNDSRGVQPRDLMSNEDGSSRGIPTPVGALPDNGLSLSAGDVKSRGWRISSWRPNMIRNTKQRDAIRRVIKEAGRPLSAAEVLTAAGVYAPGLGMATVYRTLGALLDEGFAVAVPIPGGPPRYESRDAAARHHHHFHCDGCGRVFDVPGCPRGLDELAPPGFKVNGHDLLLLGQCSACAGHTAS
jgi:Fur family transcriptional regulator, ferric uptake regulator